MERLPGFRDFYPEPLPQTDLWSADARQYIFDKWRSMARIYGFREYDGPPLEPLELFTTKSGTEIVGQLYNFKDKGERDVALRPEMTPTLARMIAAHERSYKKPAKWFSLPQLFRYERQQKGRMREHFQLNADIVGEQEPGADAELIALLIDVLRSFGLTAKDFVIRLSSGKADLPALGFGMGDVVLLELLKARVLLPKYRAALDAFCVIENEALRAESLGLIQRLRSAGLAVDYSLTPAKSDRQFKRAQELGAAWLVKLTRNAQGGLEARIRNLKTRDEKIVGPADVAKAVLAAPEASSAP